MTVITFDSRQTYNPSSILHFIALQDPYHTQPRHHNYNIQPQIDPFNQSRPIKQQNARKRQGNHGQGQDRSGHRHQEPKGEVKVLTTEARK